MGELDHLAGIKEAELDRLSNCAVCRQSMLGTENSGVTFYRLTIEHAGFIQEAIRRRVGLELQLGSSALAQVMGPNEDIAKVVSGPVTVMVHELCAHGLHPQALLMAGRERDEERAARRPRG